jgi:probable rRNA maturation factor
MAQREAILQCRLRDFPVRREALVEFLLDAMGEMEAEGSVGARIMGTRSIAEMNRKYRGRSGPTDVLSFPSGEKEETGLVYLGDIAVCGPVAAEAARGEGIRTEVELKRLLLHGLLHLLGYDHETDRGRMARKERALRKKLGL